MIEIGDKRIHLDIEDNVALITIARPEKLNALDYEMVLALELAAHLIDGMQNVRAASSPARAKILLRRRRYRSLEQMVAGKFRNGLGAPRSPRL